MRVLDEKINLKENISLSFYRNRILWPFFIVTAILDLITTLSFMYRYGIHLEQNLIVRWLAITVGIIPGVLIGKLLQALAPIGFSGLSFRLSKYVLMTLVILNLMAVYLNTL